MTQKAKKQATNLSFTLSKMLQKISTTKPSTTLFTIIILGMTIFLFGGGLYDIIVAPLPALYYGGRFYFLYPALDTQFTFDTVISGILYATGFIGLLAMYQSSKHAYNPRQAYMTMMIGAALLFIAYLFIEYFIAMKTG